MQRYIGLDVHSKSTHFCIQDAKGKTLATGEFATSKEGVQDFIAQHGICPSTKVGMETGTTSFFLSRLFVLHGLEPIVIDAHEVRLKAHRSRQKCDKRDAAEICHGIRTDMYRSIVHVPPKQISLIREALKRRRFFVNTASKQIVSVKSLLRASGIKITTASLKTAEAWKKLLARLDEYPELRDFVDSHRILFNAATHQVKKVEGLLEKLAKPFEAQLVRLQGVPGVGPVVALTTIAALSDAKRFDSAKHVASYAGLVPRMSQSGDNDRHGHITKTGNPELRSMLCEAAHHASRKNNPFNPMFSRICAKKGYKVAVVAVAHKILRILWSMLKNEKDFDLAPLGIEQGEFVTKSVRKYKLTRSTRK